jgi:hypothetical protein
VPALHEKGKAPVTVFVVGHVWYVARKVCSQIDTGSLRSEELNVAIISIIVSIDRERHRVGDTFQKGASL